ncbi:MAG TPA: hypothetical protein VL993_04530 [Stellaceae bacterium]|nr:hypothetical protein [Stellaceae bacterium]
MEPVRLLGLLEAAKEGSDYLDHAVARELGLRARPVPSVTRSLDVALSLLPKGWIMHRLGQLSDCQGGTRGWIAEISRVGDCVIPFPPDRIARTAPLAVCLAVLRAARENGQTSEAPASRQNAHR